MRIIALIILLPLISYSQIKVENVELKARNLNLNDRLIWQEVGPIKYPGTEDEYSLTGVGPVKYFNIHSENTDYCGLNSILGGLFFSNDEGKSWYNSGSDTWKSSQCAWFDFHPNDPNIVAAISIVESTKNGGRIGFQGGVMLTFDFGKTWKRIGNYRDFESDSYMSIFKVVLTEENSCYIATSRGLFFSPDITANNPIWKNLLFSTTLSDIEKFKDGLLISGKDNSTNKFFIKYLTFEKNKISKVPYSFDDKGISNIKFEVVRDKEDHFYYIAQYERRPDYLIRSDLNGEMEILRDRMQAVFGFGLALAVNPENDSIIFAGAGVTLQKSEDGGKTFKTVVGKYHVDIEGIMFHPTRNDELYIFTHGGLYKSADLGKTWENWSTGVGIGEVMGMGVGYDGYPVAIGLYHDGSLVLSKDNKWRHITPGDGLNSYVAYDDSRYVYVSNQHGIGGLFASKDSGKTFVNISKNSKERTAGWSMCFAQNTEQPEVFYFNYKRAFAQGLHEGFDVIMSNNRGLSDYYKISDFNTSHGLTKYNLWDMYVNPNMPGTLYAYLLVNDSGQTEHRLFKNDSTLSSNIDSIKNYWVEIEMPINTWIGAIEFNPLEKEEIFIIKGSENFLSVDEEDGSGMVYRVNLQKKYDCDKGKNCEDITWGLSNSFVDRLAAFADPVKNRLYVGTNQGLYYLDLETMDSWKKFGKGLPNAIIRQVKVSGDGRWIFVGTKGRGVWKHPY